MSSRTALVAVAVMASSSALALEVKFLGSSDPALKMAPITAPDGKVLNYTVGIGSGAFRHPSDPPNVIWTVGDRGPNFTCSDAEKLFGKVVSEPCRKVKSGRIYPTPEYAPSIYKVELDAAAGTFKLLETITLKNKDGKPITGLPNPQTKATRDTAVDLAGKELGDDPDNVDLEGVVRLADGTFWIGEEMGPSIAHVAADGRILKRLVPADAAGDFKASKAEIVPSLPAILSKRQANRGIETIALSPDEAFLYFILQNPLANPDAKTYQQAKNTRLFKMERTTGKLVGEYVYQLDDPMSFALDPSDKQNDPRISELSALGTDRLLVLERTEGTTKLHEITLEGATNILGGKWDEVATAPSLEAENDVAKLGITPVKKTLRFDTARDAKDAPVKIESVAFLGDGSMVLVNDNDFAITGEVTRILIVKGAVNADKAVYAK